MIPAAGDWLEAGTLAGHQPSPVVSRMVTGLALRRWREASHLSLDDAGQAIGLPGREISRREQGRCGFRLRDVAQLCDLYQITDQAERAMLLGLARSGNHPGWWQPYADLIPPWFAHYLALEQAASVIRSYDAQIVPALLQTAEYARAVIMLGHADTPAADIERRVELQMRRQDIMHSPDFHLWVLIDEAGLRRPVGRASIMRAQLRRLIEACDMPRVTIAVLPFHLGGHPAVGGRFSLLRMPNRALPDVVCLEHIVTADFYDEAAERDYYLHLLNRLVIQAQAAGPPGAVLAKILREM